MLRCFRTMTFAVLWMAIPAWCDAVQPPDFKNEVLPALTKAGCNSAACHGAAIGRGGFRLSLLGYDPRADFETLVYEYRGRRVNLADPTKSLVLLKPSRSLPHKGGMRLPRNGEAYDMLRSWIAAGAPFHESPKLNQLEISPQDILTGQPGESIQIKVTARFADGSHRDVTRWAVYEPDDPQTVKCGKQGLITSHRRGQARVLVRFLDTVQCVTVTTPLGDENVQLSPRPQTNFVDGWINRKLDQLKLVHSHRTDDATFARRVYLDLIGTLPTVDEVRRFIADPGQDKRSRLVNHLLERPEYVDYWSYKWGDLLRIESGRLGGPGAEAYHAWLREQIGANVPLDEMARQLVMSTGNAHLQGAANFHRVSTDPLEQAEYFSRVFLSVRLQCANCHNHPLDRWTQDDYHGLAAIFAKIDRRQVVRLMDRGDTIHPKTKAPAIPRIPGEDYLQTNEDLRQALLDWLTAPENPYFAKSAVNRIWKDLMGRGLVEPVDDLRASNPATHPELLEDLTAEFVRQGYDVRQMIRLITASEAYQRSSLPSGNNETDNIFYSRGLIQPLAPVVMIDAVSRVTGVPEKFPDEVDANRAISLADSQVRSKPLDLLGRCSRQADCDVTSGDTAAALPLTLHIINGDWLNDKIEAPSGRLRARIEDGLSDLDIIDHFYRMAYSRGLDSAERQYWQKQLKYDHEQQREVILRDAVWAILNSTEFRCNH